MEAVIIAAIGTVGGIIIEMVRRIGKKHDQVLTEVTPNGGTSIKDKVNKISEAVEKLGKAVEKLTEGQEKLTEGQEKNSGRLATLEKVADRRRGWGW